MMENPWQVDSIESFTYLKCPECVFDTKEKTCFQNHAIENHPLSHVLFGKKRNNLTIIDFDPNGFDSEYTESSKRAQFPKTNLHETSTLKEETSKIKNTFAETRDPLHEDFLVEITNEKELNVNQQTTVGKKTWCNTCDVTFLSDYSLKSHIETWHHYPQANKSDGNILIRFDRLGNTVHEGKKLVPALPANKIQQTCEIDEKNESKVLEENSLLATKIYEEGMKFHFETYNDANNKEEFDSKMQTVIDHGGDGNKTPCENSDKNVGKVKLLVSNTKGNKKLKKKLKCKYCEWIGNKQTGLLRSDLEKHMLYIHHGKKPECSICNINFEKERHLVEHMRNVHNKKLTYSCHICGKTIKDKEYVKRHIAMVHEGKKPFKCPLCDSWFSLKPYVKKHVATVHGVPVEERKPWSCEICKKGFTSKGNLNTHVAGSHEEKKFHCEICNLSFGYNHNLKYHNEAIHEGIKNYFCNLCDSSFYLKRKLFDHFERYHEGNEPLVTRIMKRPGDITTESKNISSDGNFIILDPLEYEQSSIEIQLSKSPMLNQNSPTKTIQIIEITKEANQANKTQQSCKVDKKIEFKEDENPSYTSTNDEGLKLHFETDNHAINIEEFNFEKQSIIDYGDDVNKPPQGTLDEHVDEIKTLVSNPK